MQRSPLLAKHWPKKLTHSGLNGKLVWFGVWIFFKEMQIVYISFHFCSVVCLLGLPAQAMSPFYKYFLKDVCWA